MLLEDLLAEVLRLQMDFQLKSLHHLERGEGSCFIEGTHKNVIWSLDLGELVSLDDERSGRDSNGGRSSNSFNIGLHYSQPLWAGE